MDQSCRAARFSSGLVLVACAVWLLGCEGALTAEDRGIAVEDSMLGGSAGAPSAAQCQVIDTADTTCDDVDDDCDGSLDEDCDFHPRDCPRGYNKIIGTAGDDTLIGTIHKDCIVGFGGDDVILGSIGDDWLIGGPGDDFIEGGIGDDVILGGDGADHLEGGIGHDRIEGGDGNDTIDAGIGHDEVRGGLCHDRIHGGLGKDDLRGDDGSDRLISARVFNFLDGGNGIDACQGSNCELSLLVAECTSDAQCGGGKQCVVATGICVPAGSVPFIDAICDGLDEDCDGRVDEEFAGDDITCGVGACEASGTAVCEDGEVVESCTPGTPAAHDATCDGTDDDCDGETDEDFASSPIICGVGACAAAGSTSCVDGMVQDDCTPGTPGSDDDCDGIDGDCDGQNDEHYVPVVTSCGVGACAATGVTSCVGGMVVDSCTAGTGAGVDATCDGIDDDCSGQIDEDFVSEATTCGVGACVGSGSTSCVNGSVIDSCQTSASAANDTTCDGIDDDCDGESDEDYAPQVIGCGIGACAATGTTACVDGDVQSICTPGTPAADDASCNGSDDDCDGQTDEHFVSETTLCGVGACAATGSTSCVGGEVHDSCTQGTGASEDTTCDGIDDDCSGEADEDYVSTMTTCGVGACASMGATSCVGGVEHDSCMPSGGAPSDFTCDGVDDDCNGQFDEDYAPHATTCGVGNCGAGGVTSCVGGVEQDSCVPGMPAGGDATCDGFDDDCDGESDEDFVSEPTTCGSGACAGSGATSCVGGSVQDSCVPGTGSTSDATCDGIDDDCDGEEDEDFVPSCAGTVSQTCVGGQVQMLECADGDACNGVESCMAGACVPGMPVDIDDGDPCTADDCDPADGSVTHTPVPAGTSCSDGLVCNGEELCLGGGAPGCASIPSNAVAWWRGENNADDSLGSHDGTVSASQTFTAGTVGQAFGFDGVAGDRVNLNAHAAALDLTTGQATLEFWMRSSEPTCRTIFALRQDGTHDQFLQLGNCNGTLTDELLTWRHINGATSSLVAFRSPNPLVLLDNNWHHVALTVDGTSTRFYVDGVQVPTSVVSGDGGDWGGFAPTLATIGARDLGTLQTTPFIGALDEMTLYDRALTAPEIAAIYMAGAAGKCQGGPGLSCVPGEDAPAGTMCEDGGVCDGAGNCQ